MSISYHLVQFLHYLGTAVQLDHIKALVHAGLILISVLTIESTFKYSGPEVTRK